MGVPVQLTDPARARLSCRDDAAVIAAHSLAGLSWVGRLDNPVALCLSWLLLPSVITGLRGPLHIPGEASLLWHHAECFAVERPSTFAVRIEWAVFQLGPVALC